MQLVKTLHCTIIHHENPFFKLGPFKLELLHQDPEIGLIHDFVSQKQCTDVMNLAKGKMKSTPYVTKGVENGYSNKRTSKVMYMNELLVPEANKLSRNIEWITRMKLKSDQYSSENFQVMNYGIGGKISSHVDSLGIRYGAESKF